MHSRPHRSWQLPQHETFQTIGVGQLWVGHHGCALFALPNPAKTTISQPSNLLYDDDVDGEPGGGDRGGDDDDGDDVKAALGVHGDRRRAPLGLSGAPPSTADATSSWGMGLSMF